MKRMIMDTADRIARLKRRLGSLPKRWALRLKRGGWLSITPPMLRSFGLRIGDVIKWQLTPRGLEGVRERSQPDHTTKRIKPRRLLGQDESIVCDFRPSFRHQQPRQITNDRPLARPNSKPSELANQCEVANVFRGPWMRFKKQPRTVSIKHFALNFERLLREVMLGRVDQISARRGQGSGLGMALVPIPHKDRMTRRHRPTKKRYYQKGSPVSINSSHLPLFLLLNLLTVTIKSSHQKRRKPLVTNT